MAMNKRGITFLYTFMLGVTIIVLGLALAQPIKQFIDDARTNLDCTNPVISDWDKAACYTLDLMKPLITGGFILIGISVIGAKLVFGGI